ELLKDRSITLDTPIRILEGKKGKVVTTTPRELLQQRVIGSNTQIRVVQTEKRVVVITLRELLKEPSVTPESPIKVLQKRRRVITTTPQQLLASQSVTLDTPIKVVTKQEKTVTTTPGQLLADKSVTLETPIKVIVEEPGEIITVSQLLKEPGGPNLSKQTFYIHTVTPEDLQGIWGIIQHGLMDQFRRGIPVPEGKGSKKQKLVTLDLPRDADEPLPNGSSSFLGKILYEKTRESYVYNFKNGRIGKNPDYIVPGQELVVTRFTQEELVKIYKHFAQSQ
ncbi:MAG: hypothetical protein JRJ26_18935, partial [Deltaproteobacteria bacterium]|nr:hypothetical protein [Deltaproteobacteria bacterium]